MPSNRGKCPNSCGLIEIKAPQRLPDRIFPSLREVSMAFQEQLFLGMVVVAFVVFAGAMFIAARTSPFRKSDD